MERHEFTKKPQKCPECGSVRIADILYGLPAYSDELMLEIKSGRTVLGGCCITDDDPKWQCADCNTMIYQNFINS